MAENASPEQSSAERDQFAPSVGMRPWQFNLRHAFELITAAAVAAALAAYHGAGALVLSAGLFVSWLNTRGRLAPVQTKRHRPKFFYAAWLLLFASLFLPAVKGCNNTTIPGWRAAHACALVELDIAHHVLIQRELPEESSLSAWGQLGWFTLLNVANLLALLSPWLLWRLQRDRGARLGAALAVVAVMVWSVPLRDPEMLVGCYVWCAGFIALTASYRMGPKTFALMALLAVFMALK
jgi:hypothetical protein